RGKLCTYGHIVAKPGGRGTIDTQQKGRLGMGLRKFAHMLACLVLDRVLDGILKVDDDRVRTRRQRLGKSLGPACRHEQGRSYLCSHQTIPCSMKAFICSTV